MTKQSYVSTAIILTQVVAATRRNILAVVGPPGSGKSALVAAMSGRLYNLPKRVGRSSSVGAKLMRLFGPHGSQLMTF